MTNIVVKHFKPYQLYRNSCSKTYRFALKNSIRDHWSSFTNYYIELHMTFLVLETIIKNNSTDIETNYSHFIKVLTTHGVHWFNPHDNQMFEELI